MRIGDFSGFSGLSVMTEQFLHHIWKYRLLRGPLFTTDGKPLQVIHPGLHNTNEGPDFLNARIRMDQTLWAGNVEIHLLASDWYRHRHHQDKGYGNIILHVVFMNDTHVRDEQGKELPALELKSHPGVLLRFEKYEALTGNKRWVACEGMIAGVEPAILTSWFERLCAERMEKRKRGIGEFLDELKGDWETMCFILLAESFGIRQNTFQFEQLARSLPLKVIRMHHSDLFQLEALMFGQAGFLEDEITDEYHQQLKKEYQYLMLKYALQKPQPGQWNFLRLRPSGFPTIRMAQLAMLCVRHGNLFRKLLDTEHLHEVYSLFDVGVSPYWETHYLFGKPVKKASRRLGADACLTILINALIPLRLLYADYTGKEGEKGKIFELLHALNPEDNLVIRRWKMAGITPRSAMDTQGLLELKAFYCDRMGCLDCPVGQKILDRTSSSVVVR